MESGKLLIIDDDPDFREELKLYLGSKGYGVITAENAQEGLKKIKAERPDLIVLDVMMERLDDGFRMCYDLKHDSEYRHIPIVIVTSVTQATGLKFNPETDGEYLEADAYYQKPVSMEELLSTIQRLLKNRG
jgi:CheY-like chemotaxis protein